MATDSRRGRRRRDQSGSPLDAEIDISLIDTNGGYKITRKRLPFREIKKYVTERSNGRPTKADLRGLKLQCYGDKESAKGSLRHNANVESISGVEIDVDVGDYPVEEAVRALEEAGIACLVATTSSHRQGDKGDRFRVFAPLSHSHLPEERVRFVGMVNAVLEGQPGHESFTLSQHIYIGTPADGGPEIETWEIEGDYLDKLNIEPRIPKRIADNQNRKKVDREALDAGEAIFDCADTKEEWERLEAAVDAIHPAEANHYDAGVVCDDEYVVEYGWRKIAAGLHGASGGSDRGLALAQRFSKKSWKYYDVSSRDRKTGKDALHDKWFNDFRIGGGVMDSAGKGTIFAAAAANGFDQKAFRREQDATREAERMARITAERRERYQPGGENPFPLLKPDKDSQFLVGVVPGLREDGDEPVIHEIVEDVIGAGDVGFVMGASGVGKTQFMSLLARRIALGDPLCGLRVERGNVLYLAGEDHSGVERRLDFLANRDGVAPIALEHVNAVHRNEKLRKELIRYVKDRDIRLIVFDTLQRTFGIDPSDDLAFTECLDFVNDLLYSAGPMCAAAITHHPTKENANRAKRGEYAGFSGRGTYQIVGASDFLIPLIGGSGRSRNVEVASIGERKVKNDDPKGLDIIKVHKVAHDFGRNQWGKTKTVMLMEEGEAPITAEDYCDVLDVKGADNLLEKAKNNDHANRQKGAKAALDMLRFIKSIFHYEPFRPASLFTAIEKTGESELSRVDKRRNGRVLLKLVEEGSLEKFNQSGEDIEYKIKRKL